MSAYARCNQRPDLHQTREGGDEADARDTAPRVRAVDDILQRRPGLCEPVVLPERRPRRDHENEAGLEEVRGEQ